MSKIYPEIDTALADWIGQNKEVFFVGSAPLSGDGHVNVSPKGGDCFRILGSREVVYQDYTGSGAETAAHLRENGRIVIMFCSFSGAPGIVRLHGRGQLVLPGDPRFAEFAQLFPANPGTRAFVYVNVERIADSCGFSVPEFEFRRRREGLNRWAAAKGPDGLRQYREEKNRSSLDGLPAFDE